MNESLGARIWILWLCILQAQHPPRALAYLRPELNSDQYAWFTLQGRSAGRLARDNGSYNVITWVSLARHTSLPDESSLGAEGMHGWLHVHCLSLPQAHAKPLL